MSREWFDDFFGGLAVEFWVKAAPPPNEAELNFLEETFSGKRILDLACGAGRFTIPLSQMGYRMTGVDISPEFLAIATRSAAGHQGAEEIRWHQGDMRELPWTEEFDGAFCFGNSFAYSDRRGTRRFLLAVANALEKGAPFVLETGVTAESLLPSLQLQRWIQIGEILFLSKADYDASQSRLDVEYSFVKDGLRETRGAQYWIYTVSEVTQMLLESGFELTALYSSERRERFVLGSPHAIFLCTRV